MIIGFASFAIVYLRGHQSSVLPRRGWGWGRSANGAVCKFSPGLDGTPLPPPPLAVKCWTVEQHRMINRGIHHCHPYSTLGHIPGFKNNDMKLRPNTKLVQPICCVHMYILMSMYIVCASRAHDTSRAHVQYVCECKKVHVHMCTSL